MVVWLIVAFVICLVIIGILACKLYLLRRSIREITEGLSEKLSLDTNTTISISSSDPYARALAGKINYELKALRKERLKLQYGDTELTNAVTNIAHDLRTPLTAISGYLELLENEETSEKVSKYIDVIRERTKVLKELTKELFHYSVITSTADQLVLLPTSLNKELEIAFAGNYGALTKRNISPSIVMPEKAVMRDLDKAALQRIFSNIIGNAVKYSDGDFGVVLTEDGTIIFSNKAKSLSEVEVGKLFDRFYTVENAVGSAGLGLSIAKLLTEKMGGKIEAVYVEGELKIKINFKEK